MSVTVALTALLISAASLWLTALRPARFNLTYMHEHTKIGRGGKNEVPNICSIRAFMALTNSGARAGLLERVGWGSHFEGQGRRRADVRGRSGGARGTGGPDGPAR